MLAVDMSHAEPHSLARPPMAPLRIGTAGWSVPSASRHRFADAGEGGTHLERYARQLPAVEINSSFYRPHQRSTYERWAASTPEAFRFCVKLPRAITHNARLKGAEPALDAFLDQVQGLGSRLGCLLVQLPPSLRLDLPVAEGFLRALRARYGQGDIAVEPRHASWFTPEGDALLNAWRAARVLADPVLHPGGEAPGGWPGLVYCRLHGSPHVYYSAYDAALIDALAARLRGAAQGARAVWCIFDNTAAGAAAGNALDLQAAVVRGPKAER